MFEEEPAEVSLKPPKMECDYPLCKREIKTPFPNKSFFMVLSGKAGSGKSSFLMSLLNQKKENRVYRGVFKNIIFVCPSLSSLPKGLLDGIPEEQLFEDFTPELVEMINQNNEDYQEKPKKQYSQLLVLDDVASLLKLKQNQILLNKLAFNRRHKRLSVILTTQYIYMVPKSVRANVSDVVLFAPTAGEYETINKEFVQMPKDKFKMFMRFVFREPHDTLYIDENRDFYRNLGRIVDKSIENEDETPENCGCDK